MSSNSTSFEYEMLDDARYIPLMILAPLSSTVSIIGSCCILYMSYPKLGNEIKQRLLFCLSLADLFLSASIVVMPFAIPSDLGLPGAVGNHASCTVAGLVFSTAGKTSCYVNAYLSLYFLLLVKYNWKENYFTWPLELVAHLVPLVIIFGIEIFAAATQSINPTPLFNNLCLYAESPWGCDGVDLPCERSSLDTADSILHVSFPFYVICSLLGFLCTSVVFVTVRKTFGKTRAYRFESTINNAMDASKASQRVGVDANQERLRQVGIQAISYFLAYLNALFWPILVVITTKTSDEMDIATTLKLTPGVYCLQLLFWAFFPLQGALNFFVYTRAKYHEWRKRRPEASRLWIYQQIVAGADVPMGGTYRHRFSSSSKPPTQQQRKSGSIEEPDASSTPLHQIREVEESQMA